MIHQISIHVISIHGLCLKFITLSCQLTFCQPSFPASVPIPPEKQKTPWNLWLCNTYTWPKGVRTRGVSYLNLFWIRTQHDPGKAKTGDEVVIIVIPTQWVPHFQQGAHPHLFCWWGSQMSSWPNDQPIPRMGQGCFPGHGFWRSWLKCSIIHSVAVRLSAYKLWKISAGG